MPDYFVSRVRILFAVAVFSLLSIGFFFRLPTKASAADLWVNGTLGNDGIDCTNSCTNSNNPCASIQCAANQTFPGDTVNVYATGTYSGDITVTRSGEQQNPIFYQPWPGTGVVNLVDAVITIDTASFIGITSFDIFNSTNGIDIINSDHILLENLFLHGMTTAVSVNGGLGDVLIVNNTIYANNDEASYGVYLATVGHFAGPVTIENNIIANAQYGVYLTSGGVLEVRGYNDMWSRGNQHNYGNLIPGIHDITADPVFFDAAGGDFHTSTTSPVIDAGTTPTGPGGEPAVTLDCEERTRPQGAAYDIGAYEYVPPSSPPGLSSAGALSSCSDSAPTGAISLYKIATLKTAAKLYFTPIKDATSYQIFFGYKAGDTRFAGTFPSHSLPYTIDHLSPNITYYFAVRGENNCAGGKLSNWLSATTDSSSQSGISLSGSSPKPSPVGSGTTITGGNQPTSTPSPAPTMQSSNFFSSIINFFKQLFHF